jgi:type II secretory pathway component PulK
MLRVTGRGRRCKNEKGLLITLLVALLLVLVVPVALALTDSQKTELESLYRQQHELRLQILEKQKEAGLIDEEQDEFFREKMEQRW